MLTSLLLILLVVTRCAQLAPGTGVSEVDLAGLDAAAGVGVEVTAEQVEAAVEAELATVKEDVLANRWRFNAGPLMGRVRAKLKWADGKAVKSEVELQLLDLLGPKTDEDLLPPPKKEKSKGTGKAGKGKDGSGKGKVEAGQEDKEEEEGAATIMELMKTKVISNLSSGRVSTNNLYSLLGSLSQARREPHHRRLREQRHHQGEAGRPPRQDRRPGRSCSVFCVVNHCNSLRFERGSRPSLTVYFTSATPRRSTSISGTQRRTAEPVTSVTTTQTPRKKRRSSSPVSSTWYSFKNYSSLPNI